MASRTAPSKSFRRSSARRDSDQCLSVHRQDEDSAFRLCSRSISGVLIATKSTIIPDRTTARRAVGSRWRRSSHHADRRRDGSAVKRAGARKRSTLSGPSQSMPIGTPRSPSSYSLTGNRKEKAAAAKASARTVSQTVRSRLAIIAMYEASDRGVVGHSVVATPS